MEVIGIICEYNPFHNGHLYHIKKIKEMYSDSLIILVLNGYFLERGEISILSKEAKTKIALAHGVDIILELPVIYGTQSADTFASISLKILNNFHVNKIIFGSESNEIEKIKEIASKQLDEEYNKLVKEYLDNGLNYPTALAKALNIDFEFLPNDLLGISYTKAIIQNNYNIEPITIKRTSAYHDTSSNDHIVSASNIREKIKNNEDISKYIPINIKDFINNTNYENYFKLLKYKINTDNYLNKYLDVDEGIEYRLLEYINKPKNIDEFINNIKTKRYTYNKLNRMFIHILLSFLKTDNIDIEYIKILGFNSNGKKYLNSIKENLEISTNINKDSIQYKYELKASIIYDLINNTNTYEFEQRNKPIIID
ncbi:MAG TPA: nucleotidyltransferase [Candidatus Onthocola stercorigallinarum]|nr:nucleotidyltransferase [Candidatus Onthocola stercorigallinarum]